MKSETKAAVRHIGIIAATYTGNRGAEAMLQASLEGLRRHDPATVIHVLSYAPGADRQWLSDHPVKDVFIHSCTPARLVLHWLPGAVLCKLLPFLRRRPSGRHGQSIFSLLKLDGVVDLAGVSFIDGREKFLPFNVLTLLPFVANGVPVFKLSQAMGPFRNPLNRTLARWVLGGCRSVVARGRKTAEHLKELGLASTKWLYAPDTAFSLPLANAAVSRERDIAFMPSSLMAGKHADYAAKMADAVRELTLRGRTVTLIAHSWKGDSDRPRNNDLPVCHEIAALAGGNVPVVGLGLDARGLKQEVSRHKVAVTSRFHGMVAALDTVTPPLVLGWSHKYREVLAEFAIEDWALKYEQSSATQVADAVELLLARQEELSGRIATRLPEVRAQSEAQFERVMRTVNSVAAPFAVSREAGGEMEMVSAQEGAE